MVRDRVLLSSPRLYRGPGLAGCAETGPDLSRRATLPVRLSHFCIAERSFLSRHFSKCDRQLLGTLIFSAKTPYGKTDSSLCGVFLMRKTRVLNWCISKQKSVWSLLFYTEMKIFKPSTVMRKLLQDFPVSSKYLIRHSFIEKCGSCGSCTKQFEKCQMIQTQMQSPLCHCSTSASSNKSEDWKHS